MNSKHVLIIAAIIIAASIMAAVIGYRVGVECEKERILGGLSVELTYYLADLHDNITALLQLTESNSTVEAIRYEAEALDYNVRY